MDWKYQQAVNDSIRRRALSGDANSLHSPANLRGSAIGMALYSKPSYTSIIPLAMEWRAPFLASRLHRPPTQRVRLQDIPNPIFSVATRGLSKSKKDGCQLNISQLLPTVSLNVIFNAITVQLLNSPGVQQTVHGDGGISPKLNTTTGQPITVFLNETIQSTIPPISERSTLFERLQERDNYFRERDSACNCGCVWLWT